LVRELSWTHNLLIMSRCKRAEERAFYLRLCHREKWGKRELERQLNGALFERTVLSPTKLSAPLRELHPDAAAVFKDTYLLEFLDLPPAHSEADLQRGLVEKLKQFLIELGRDFCFIGSYYPIQVGGRDFEIDLLFFNRALNCPVAFELKIEEFQPEHLGQLEFYLEALDRDVRKPHEGPSIGVLLCATKDYVGGRVRPEPGRLTGPGGGVPDPPARQEAAAGQAPRVLRAGPGAGRTAGPRRAGTSARQTVQATEGEEVMTPCREKLIEAALPPVGKRRGAGPTSAGRIAPSACWRLIEDGASRRPPPARCRKAARTARTAKPILRTAGDSL